MQNQTVGPKLLTAEFIALNTIMFLTYCNIAVFFQFQSYLASLPNIPHFRTGLLIGLFSVSVVILRPIVSPFVTPKNAKFIIAASCISVMVSLLLYNLALDTFSMALVRLAHGVAYVVLAVAVLTKLVAEIPKDRSGQAFGLISVITVAPYAIVPPLLDPLIGLLGGFLPVLNLSALLMFLTLPLLYYVKSVESSLHLHDPIDFSSVKVNLSDPSILRLLLLGLIIWSTFTPVFYFISDQALSIQISNAGWFFTLSTVSEISVRLLAGPYFDRGNKAVMLAVAMFLLALGYILLAHVGSPISFYALGLFLGLGWGVSMPLLNGLMFDLSEPRFRPLNTNLAMQMFQLGFFLGPFLGNYLIVYSGFKGLYYVCAATLTSGIFMALKLRRSSAAPASSGI